MPCGSPTFRPLRTDHHDASAGRRSKQRLLSCALPICVVCASGIVRCCELGAGRRTCRGRTRGAISDAAVHAAFQITNGIACVSWIPRHARRDTAHPMPSPSAAGAVDFRGRSRRSRSVSAESGGVWRSPAKSGFLRLAPVTYGVCGCVWVCRIFTSNARALAAVCLASVARTKQMLSAAWGLALDRRDPPRGVAQESRQRLAARGRARATDRGGRRRRGAPRATTARPQRRPVASGRVARCANRGAAP